VTSKSEQAEPVALYVEEHRLLPMTLRRKLEALLEDKRNGLIGGLAKTFDEYRYRVGEVKGLSDAIAICQEVEKQLSPD